MDIPGILLNASHSFEKGGREALSIATKQFIDVYHGKPITMKDYDVVSCVKLFIKIHSADHPKTLSHIEEVECLLRWFASLIPVRQAFHRTKDEAWRVYHEVMMASPSEYPVIDDEQMQTFNIAHDPAFIYGFIQAAQNSLQYLDDFHHPDGRLLIH